MTDLIIGLGLTLAVGSALLMAGDGVLALVGRVRRWR